MKTLKLRHPPWGCKLPQTSFPDIKLTTQDGCGKVVTGHRVLMASVSSKLAELFSGQKKEVVLVRNVRFSHLEIVVNFFYTGSVCVGDEGEGEFTEEDLHDVLNLLQVNKEELGEIEDSEIVQQEWDCTEPEDTFGGSVNRNIVFLEEESNCSPSTRNMDRSPNENEDADKSELSNNNVSVESSIKSVEDLRRRHNSKQEHPDDKTGNDSQKKIKRNTNRAKRRSVEVHCMYCMQKVKYDDFSSHCRTFHPESPFDVQVKCEECSIQAISKVSLQFHKRIFHPQGVEDCYKNSPQEILTEEEKVICKSIIKCEFCDNEVCFDNYFKHCRTKHQKLHKVQWTEKVECPACKDKKAEGIFVSRACLPLHMKKYHGDLTSEAGEDTYNLGLRGAGSREIARRLKIAKRIDGSLIPCEFCPNKKVRYFSYQRHCKNVHVEVPQKNTECSICNRSVFVYSLKYHNLLYHPETTPNFQQDEKVKNQEPKLEDKTSPNTHYRDSKEGQKTRPSRLFFTYKSLMKKSFVCVNYYTKISVLFEKYISSLEVDMKSVNREQVVFRCRKVNLTGFESVGLFHNQTVEVIFL